MKFFKLLVLPAFLLSFYAPVTLAATDVSNDVAHSTLPKIVFEKFTLPNGLDVILVEDHKLPIAAVNIWYHVGAANEKSGLTGFAHLFEHMMFAASKHVPRGMADKLLEGAGVTDSNGSTSFDRTNYYDTVPSNQLELALWIHSDRMGYLLDVLDQTALSNQQDVVRNERRQNYENRPYGIVEEAVYHQLFPKAHPYHASVIGSHADIQAAKLDDIKDFFKTYYRPNNASLVIVGDIDKARTKLLVAKYFGHFKQGAEVQKVKVVTPPITTERRAVIHDRIELPRVFMSWLTSQAFAHGDAELSVAAQILGGGKSSRLYKSLVYDKQIAQDVSATQDSNALSSIFTIDVTARPGHTAQEIEAAIDIEMKKMRDEGPSLKEMERAQNTIETAMLTQIEKVGGLANQLNQYNQYVGDPGYLTKDIERYRQVKAVDVQRIMAAQLQNNTRSVVVGLPGTPKLGVEIPTPPMPKKSAGKNTSTAALNTAQAWRKRIPTAGPVKPFVLPKGDIFTLDNGLTVIHRHNSALPIVAAELVIKSGSGANPSDKSGLASLTAQMLEEGTTNRTALQIADEIAQLGAFLSTGSSADSSSVEVLSLKANFNEVLDVLVDIVRNPAFPAEEVERQRASRLGELSQQRESAQSVAKRVELRVLYGDEHPYGYTELGTEGAVKSTQRSDLNSFWSQHYVPNNAALVISGDITLDELKILANEKFGTWRSSVSIQPTVKQASTTKARLVLVDKPGAPQSAVRLSAIGPDRKTPDFEALQVMNAALGGLFTSRLNTVLREEKGYTYGVRSGFQYHRLPGPFAISSSIRTDVTGVAVADMFKEVRSMIRTPMSPTELDSARNSQVLSLPGQFETNNSFSTSLADIFIYDLGLDYYSGLAQRYASVTAPQVQTVMKKYLRPENLIVISVGDQVKIKPQLTKLKLGSVEYRDADGNLLK